MKKLVSFLIILFFLVMQSVGYSAAPLTDKDELTVAPAETDIMYIVDLSEPLDADKSKKIETLTLLEMLESSLTGFEIHLDNLEATLADIADGTIVENLVNTANPWAENEIVSTVVVESDVDDTPVDSATTDPVSSNWAYDHVAAADPHAGYLLETALNNEAELYALLSDVSDFIQPGDVVQTDASTTLPASCTVGQMYIDTNADTNGSLYICVTTDTWKEVDDDGSTSLTTISDGDSSIVVSDSGIGTISVTVDGNIIFVVDSTGIIMEPVSDPTLLFRDSDAPGTDKDVAWIKGSYIDGADGSENADLILQIIQAGTENTEVLRFDESDDRWESTKAFDVPIYMSTYADADGYSIPATEVWGNTFYATGAGTWALPAIAAGMNLCIENHTDGDVYIDPNGTEQLKPNGGTALTAGYRMLGTDTGDIACLTYYSAGVWSVQHVGYADAGS